MFKDSANLWEDVEIFFSQTVFNCPVGHYPRRLASSFSTAGERGPLKKKRQRPTAGSRIAFSISSSERSSMNSTLNAFFSLRFK